MRARLGAGFGWLWSAYAVSTYGTWIAFGAFPLLAVRVLHSPAFAVSLLGAASLAVAAGVAIPLGPWVERRNKRSVMIAMDLVRFLAMASVPAAYLFDLLSYGQLLAVSVISATAGIAFTAASGAYLKHLVSPEHLLVANGRFEGTSWMATAAGPPLGGALIGLLGPVITVAADAVSYLLSAFGILRIRGGDVAAPRPAPPRTPAPRTAAPGTTAPRTAPPREAAAGSRGLDILSGWRFIFRDHALRRLFLNAMTVNGLIMATSPLLTVLLLDEYHLPAWQYGLAFGLPALGGLAGARSCALLVTRYGQYRVLMVSGWLRSTFPLGLALTRPGVAGLLIVITTEALLIICMGVFNPISATERLRRAPADHTAQVLSAWSISSRIAQASLMAIWGGLATLTSPLTAITAAGVLLLATPLFLPRRTHLPDPVLDAPAESGRVKSTDAGKAISVK
ncbi:MFS transporter [Parafrankia sp. EUN1f]|uniref:MFS transporter n=1 Tax=Parafrankia sp. EUN1f TaxID=102897 RepID=UPI0001C44B07|nr:MFS transporter [Parafrankia sp. EUN1f]EFC82947.1 major facilitator superfamily MFS_1 [Parafrankia sp. EUN1f]